MRWEQTAAAQSRAFVVGDDQSLSHEEKLKRTHAILHGWDRMKPGWQEQSTAPDNGAPKPS
jgi:hypothetical protein